MKVVTDKGEGDKCKKKFKRLDNFFFEKRPEPFFVVYSLCDCFRRRNMFVC